MHPYVPFILLSMILSNVGHILLVKKNAFSRLAVPVYQAAFGSNKTWRGFILLLCLNALASWGLNFLFQLFAPTDALIIGAVLGLAYMLSELPNSWFKRHWGVESGARAQKHSWLFALMDKTDSSLGVSLTSWVLFDFTFGQTLWLFVLGSLTHVFFSWLLVLAGIKKRF